MLEPQEILTRLHSLERAVKIWKCVAIALVLGFMSLLIMGQTPPSKGVIEATRLILRDTEGRIRVIVGGFDTKEDINATLTGKEKVMRIDLDDEQTLGRYGVSVFSEKGVKRLNLSSDEKISHLKLRQGWDKTNYIGLHVDNNYASLSGKIERDKEETDVLKRAKAIENWTKKYKNAKNTEERERLLKDTIDEHSYFEISSYGGTRKDTGFASLVMRNTVNSFEKEKGWVGINLGEINGLVSGRDSQINLRDFDSRSRATLGVTALKKSTGVVENRPPSSLVLFDLEGNVLSKLPQ